MLLEAIYHRSKSNYAYAYDTTTLHIRVRTRKDDMSSVKLYYCDKYAMEHTGTFVEMKRFASDTLFDYYQAEAHPPFRRCAYGFYFESGDESIWYVEKGFIHEKPDRPVGLFEFPFLHPVDVFTPPEWVKDAVFYQIFLERFSNGDLANDPEGVEPWGGKPDYDNFFGGDLQGVIDHIDHLTTLGINALYFTPVFEATTNHKYDTVDYLKVDPHFGDRKLLKVLVNLCHENGIRVMLDAVFNHAGYYFPPFQDVLKNQGNSKYADWFHLREFPVKIESQPNYDTFAFTHTMPKLNTENTEVKEYLLNVARDYIEDIGIDGWRLDVANEVDHAFWREFRRVVKKANPEVYILGEIWHNSSAWLQGDQFDAVMNYPVTNTILDFFCKNKMDAHQFRSELEKMHAEYPLQVNEVAFNLLDSHDTPRLLTICNENKDRMKLAAAFQLTYIGAPCIYYGDEIGLTGGEDPDCRKTMVWEEEKQDHDLFEFYQKMIHLRKTHSALRQGSLSFLQAESGTKQLVVERQAKDEHFVILMNACDAEAVIPFTLPSGDWDDLLTETQGLVHASEEDVCVTLLPYEFKILKRRIEETS